MLATRRVFFAIIVIRHFRVRVIFLLKLRRLDEHLLTVFCWITASSIGVLYVEVTAILLVYFTGRWNVYKHL